jgi:hypothetical protein
MQHATTVTLSPLSALVNFVAPLTLFVVIIFGGTLFKEKPVSSILKIRCGLLRILISVYIFPYTYFRINKKTADCHIIQSLRSSSQQTFWLFQC